MTTSNDPNDTPTVNRDRNADPLTGAPGSHPIGTGAGAAGGAAAGAVAGTMIGGPVGFVVGGVAGAVAGGLAGKGVAEMIDPTGEDTYWRENYASRPYVSKGDSYETHEPAYRYGWEARSRMVGKDWPEVEEELSSGWEGARGQSTRGWTDARPAAHDAWMHAQESVARVP